MILKIASSCKDLFGRKPSVSDELDKREGLFRLELDQLRLQLDQHKTHVEGRFADLEIQRSRHWDELHEKINGVSDAVARIEGLLEVRRK
jgi:hypothetical protein